MKLSIVPFLCCWIFSFTGGLISQSLFNNIYQQQKIALTFSESLWQNDTMIIAATYIDSTGKTQCSLNYLDKDGTFILSNDQIDTSIIYSYQFFSKGLKLIHDTIYQFGYKAKSSDTTANGVILYGLLLKFNKNGERIFETEYKGKYFPEEHFARPNDFEILEDKLVVTYLTWEHLANQPNAQICITKSSFNGSIEWDECFGNENRENSNDLLVTSDGDIIVIGDSHNLYLNDDYQGSGNAFWKGYIFKTDNLGNLQWEWRSPSLYESANAAVLENDSILVVAAGYGVEFCDVPGDPLSWCSIYWTGGAYKMNLNTRNKIWESSLSGGPYTTKNDNQYFDIIPSLEKDGYILCGSGYEIAYPGCQQIDTQKCWSYPGVIAKVSNDGDSVWLRKYFGVTDIWESNALFDAEIGPDSIYSFVGAAYNPFPGETEGQHGWLLITDKHGCLVPGCHLISSIDEAEENNIHIESLFKIFPNPTSDFINVLITGKVHSGVTLQLTTIMGQVINSWTGFEIGATYIIPIDDMVPGTYFINLKDGNIVLDNQLVIIN